MTDNKKLNGTETDTVDNTQNGVDELARIVDNHLNPVSSSSTTTTVSSPTSSTRMYTPPLMGTSARAAKRRMDSDSGPIRIEGVDTYNQHLQHHYQNVRQIIEEQQQNSNTDSLPESRQSFSAKRNYFEDRFKTPPPQSTTGSPLRQQGQKLITQVTTTTSSIPDRTSSSSNESPSVDRVLEQAVELQKLSHLNSSKTYTESPVIIERTEEYQVFLDDRNHEIRRTPSISRTSVIQTSKTGYATDLDQAQAQIEQVTDDHQAIQNLTRALQEHNVTTINEYKRLPSQTNQNSNIITTITSSTLPTSPARILHDRTNLPIKSEYSVIDAILNNPLGTIDDKTNSLLNIRYNDIMTNLHNPEYVNTLKRPQKTTTKENKLKQKSSVTTDTVEHAIITPLINAPEVSTIQTKEQPITTKVSSEQTPLIDPKEKKKQDKENKKQIKTKSKPQPEPEPKLKPKPQPEPKLKSKPIPKSKSKSKNADYHVLDAIIGSPVTIRLPDSYLSKYNVSPPLSLSSPLQSIPPSSTVVTTTATTTTTETSKDKDIPTTDKYQTLYHLTKIVKDLQLHHSTLQNINTTSLPPLSSSSSPPSKTTSKKESKVTDKQSAPIVNEVVRQQPSVEQQYSNKTSNQIETRPQSEPIKPRIIYRYMDEQGRILKISSTPPSQLRDQPAQLQPYRNTDPAYYYYSRRIPIDDERRYLLPEYEQHITWQGESKVPTTVTREDLELRDRRIPQLSEQAIPTGRTVPVSVENEYSPKKSSHQSRTYHYPNQQNVKLAWLPLSYPTEQQYIPTGTAGYDTDSTISEPSATYRTYDYGPTDNHYRYTNRPLYNDYYYSSPSYYPPAPPLPYGGRGISPDYGNLSRNYIEVFRGGDFRETKPSEIYSLPLNEHLRTSPISPTNSRHSRYDQYQSERYGTISNHQNAPSSQQNYYNYSNSLPHSRYQNIPPSTVHTSSHYTHRSPHHRTVQSSPQQDYKNYIRQSKSFDYRPLRTRLQREYKITPNLLVDEWDYPPTSNNMKYSTTTSTTNRSEARWHVKPTFGFDKNRFKPLIKSLSYHDNRRSQKSEEQDVLKSTETRINNSQPINKAVALHNFYAQTNRELPFKKGDTIFVKRRINDDWLEGEHQGLTGIFPVNHVELFPYDGTEQELQNEGEAIVKFDFIPQKSSELQLRKGEKVILLRKLDNNWYEGRLNNTEGIFPAENIEIIREPKNNTNIVKMPKSVLKNSTKQSQPTATEKTNIVPETSSSMQKCEVLYDYTPQNPDELEIHPGDIITILEICDDGWYCGVMEKKTNNGNDSMFGTFPGNYVKLLPA